MGLSSISRAAAAVLLATLLVLPAVALADAPDLRATQLTPSGGLGPGGGNTLIVTVAYDSNEQFLPLPAFRVTLRVSGNGHDQSYHETITLTGPQLDQTPPSGVHTATFTGVTFPAAGTYQVRVYADDTNVVPETDELHDGGQPAGGGAGQYGTVNTDSNNYLSFNCLPNASGTGGCTTLPVLLQPIPGRVVEPAPACPRPYRVIAADGRCVWSCGAGTQPEPRTNTCVCQPGHREAGTDRFGRRVCQ